MDAIGAEVGQKMRSAIKAKLMELGCYVDDELPDYIMVMVANKRSKAQMEDDLQLFLRSDTKVFVEWLQQVLKKLKEVTITNPDVCSSFKELKRKATMEIVEVAIKKERKEKRKTEKSVSASAGAGVSASVSVSGGSNNAAVKSLTDDIPVQAQNLLDKRNENIRVHVREIKAETSKNSTNNIVHEDNFDIPSLAEVNALEDSQLEIVENKIKEARNRIVLMKSDSEDDEDFINIKADGEDLLNNEIDTVKDKLNTNRILNLKRFNKNSKPPMSERLGARPTQLQNQDQESGSSNLKKSNEEQRVITTARNKISMVEEQILSGPGRGRIRSTIQSIITKPVENNKVQKKRESVHKRLGLPSAVVSLPKKVEYTHTNAEQVQVQVQNKSVLSVVQVKPRRNVPGVCQANKKLLLLAVAEAQKSIALTPVVGKTDKNALFTKKYRDKNKQTKSFKESKKNQVADDKLKNIIIQVKRKNKHENKESEDYERLVDDYEEECNEYIPETVSKETEDEYIPSPSLVDLNYDEDLDDFSESNNEISTSQKSRENNEEEKTTTNQQFIVTLDGLKDKKFISSSVNDEGEEGFELVKRPPSPIVFNVETKAIIPDVVANVDVNADADADDRNTLPKISVPPSIKTKERCKYWPNCRLKDSCEFLHPTTSCKMFPMCKFGDRCLYIHPKCKFDASCTRKDCPYSHNHVAVKMPSKIGIVARTVPNYQHAHVHSTEICKYFPNCSNPHCSFYHPKPCRFGQYCLNKSECNFSHGKIPNKEKLTWHSNAR